MSNTRFEIRNYNTVIELKCDGIKASQLCLTNNIKKEIYINDMYYLKS